MGEVPYHGHTHFLLLSNTERGQLAPPHFGWTGYIEKGLKKHLRGDDGGSKYMQAFLPFPLKALRREVEKKRFIEPRAELETSAVEEWVAKQGRKPKSLETDSEHTR